MKKIRVLGIAILTAVVLCACGGEQELADISTAEGDGYMAIIWEENRGNMLTRRFAFVPLLCRTNGEKL